MSCLSFPYESGGYAQVSPTGLVIQEFYANNQQSSSQVVYYAANGYRVISAQQDANFKFDASGVSRT